MSAGQCWCQRGSVLECVWPVEEPRAGWGSRVLTLGTPAQGPASDYTGNLGAGRTACRQPRRRRSWGVQGSHQHPARALAGSAPRAPGPAASRTHRVPLSPMVRGGRREVHGVSAQVGKSPAGRRSAGLPAPGSLLRLLRSLASGAAAAAPAPSRTADRRPPNRPRCCAAPRPRPGAGAARGCASGPCARVSGGARAAQPAARQSGGRRQGPQGIWGFTRVRVQMCVCVWYMWCAREGARRGGYTCACVHGRVCRCGYVCTPCARADQECILADGAVCTSLCSCACVQARYPRARRGAFVCAGR